ncbi:MAG: hypothetical protein K0U45_05050 [Alphaproteobacteria bacterium]|nr:hypothetical protein [Alphaproteobacteria bacterium]
MKLELYEKMLDDIEEETSQNIITVANHQQIVELSNDISVEISKKDNELKSEAKYFAEQAKQGIDLMKQNAGKASILVIKSIKHAFESLLTLCLALPGFEILCEMINKIIEFLANISF